MKAILIFGPPGSGKGTQSSYLSDFDQIYHLSSGEVFRKLDPSSRWGQIAKKFADKGELLPDDITMQIIQNHIDGLIKSSELYPKSQMLLLDGIPRTVQQAEILDTFVEVIGLIVIQVEESTLQQRILKRSQLEQRKDDSIEVFQKRMQIYREITANLLNYYPKELQVLINGEAEPMVVHKEILEKGRAFLGK